MLSSSLKCKKYRKQKTWGLQRQIKENQCFYQKMQCAVVVNWELSENKKLVDYRVS